MDRKRLGVFLFVLFLRECVCMLVFLKCKKKVVRRKYREKNCLPKCLLRVCVFGSMHLRVHACVFSFPDSRHGSCSLFSTGA